MNARGITPWHIAIGAGWKGGGRNTALSFVVRNSLRRRIDYGDAGLCKSRYSAIMAEESPVMGHEAPRAASAAFHCAGGVIGWVCLANGVGEKLNPV